MIDRLGVSESRHINNACLCHSNQSTSNLSGKETLKVSEKKKMIHIVHEQDIDN